MKNFTEELYSRLQNALIEIELKYDNLIERYEHSCEKVRECLTELKTYVADQLFSTSGEEIEFFKEIKPKFYAQLIYFAKLYDTESRLPILLKEQKRHYKRELEKIHFYFEEQREFHKYYRQKATHMDESYFLRDKFDIKLSPDLSYMDSDPSFRTNKDYQMSKLLGYEMLNTTLSSQLAELECSNTNDSSELENMALPWTDTKAGLIELLYGIQCMGSLNNSQAGLTQIARLLEKAFKVNLGNYARGFMELSIRKKSRTPFLDRMREMIIKKMDDLD